MTRWTCLAALLAVATLALGVKFGSTVAGGADSYGYVSQAGLWRAGAMTVQQDIIRQSPWPWAIETWSPLGYRPRSDRQNAIVPQYPIGLPLLMALFQIAGGYCAAFLVVPCCGALVVWLTYALGVRVFGEPLIALLAAVMVAASPVFLYQLMNPMSDVPAAAAWTLAMVLVISGQPLSSGLAAGALLLIRPNLAPLAIVLVAWAAMSDRRSAVRLLIGFAPAVAAMLVFNARVYGSPLASGYGSVSQYYSWAFPALNLRRYTASLVDVHTPVVAIAGLYFIAPSWFPGARIPFPRALLGGTLAVVLLSYLFYVPFDAWWYLRFFLPVWPVLMLLMSAGLEAIARRAMPRAAPVLLCVGVGLLAWRGVQMAVDRRAFDLGRGDRRYVNVARFVDEHTDRDAVILAMQHSGSLRLYSGRLTLRWDLLDPVWLDRAVAHLQAMGRRPYIVLDGDEVGAFRAHYQGASRLAALDWRPVGRLSDPDVFVYDLIDRERVEETRAINSIGSRRYRRCDLPHSWPPVLRMK